MIYGGGEIFGFTNLPDDRAESRKRHIRGHLLKLLNRVEEDLGWLEQSCLGLPESTTIEEVGKALVNCWNRPDKVTVQELAYAISSFNKSQEKK